MHPCELLEKLSLQSFHIVRIGWRMYGKQGRKFFENCKLNATKPAEMGFIEISWIDFCIK
jgi:hypothetical protein